MFSDLAITVYCEYRKREAEPKHKLARQQWRALRDIVSGYYILQRD